ncbi:hypothetical protein [Lentzea fradiae]|nr:hypothetical protein [Lentzea fradiae]
MSIVEEATANAANEVRAQSEVTIMPAEQFNEFIATLDVADVASNLIKLGTGCRRYARD